LTERARHIKLAAGKGHADDCWCFPFPWFGCHVAISAAEELFWIAPDQGHSNGQFNCAIAHLPHVESDHDCQEISSYLNVSTDQGCVFAEVSYGVYLFGGLGVPVDSLPVAKWLEKAARLADEHGLFNYGLCLFEGKEFQSIEVKLSGVLEFWRRGKMPGAL
jgi:TPR repeat protein